MKARDAAHCYRCGLFWFPRKARVRMCARCKSPYFDVPKLRIPTYGGGLGIDEVFGPKRSRILALARTYGARNVRVFGSVARKTATAVSDVDLLVDPVRYRFDAVSLALRAEDLLGRRVDVIAEQALHWLVQPQVVAEAVPL